jgi:hypothetical protein
MYWLLNRKSKLSLENKLIIYKHKLKPIWIYGIELWGCSKPPNTKILQSFQSKTLRMRAPWYVSNQTLHEDLKIPLIQDIDRLCGLVVKVPGYRYRGPGSIPGATRFFSEK